MYELHPLCYLKKKQANWLKEYACLHGNFAGFLM